jgi:hypothetical protein
LWAGLFARSLAEFHITTSLKSIRGTGECLFSVGGGLAAGFRSLAPADGYLENSLTDSGPIWPRHCVEYGTFSVPARFRAFFMGTEKTNYQRRTISQGSRDGGNPLLGRSISRFKDSVAGHRNGMAGAGSQCDDR